MLALLITGSAFSDFHFSVRADEEVNTSDSQAQTDAGTEDGVIISPDYQDQTDAETEDELTDTSDSQDQTETEAEDESTNTFDSQDQTETETEDEFTNTFDSQDQADTETEDELIMTFDAQEQTDAGTGDGFTITASEIEMNGEPLKDGDSVYSGAKIKITLNWDLDDNKVLPEGTKFTPQEFVIDVSSLDLKGIVLSDISENPGESLWYNGEVVGKYYLKDGKIHIVIDNEEFYQNRKGRHGGLTFEGEIEKDENVKNDGTKKEVGIGDKSVLTDYYLTDKESSVSVNKSLSGDLNAEIVNGEMKYYQTYKVTVKAENGTVHNIDLQDIPSVPGSLTNPDDVKIAINRAGAASPEEHTYNSLDEAFAAIKAIDNLYKGESIDIYYTMEVSDHIFDQDVWGYDNTVSGQYTSNRSEERKDTGTGYARVTVDRPEINKEGVGYEVRDGKGYVKWKITIKLNDLYDEDITDLQSYIDQVIDIPGDKFVKPAQEKLDLSKFTDEGNGVYTYEYELEVTEDVFNSLAGERVSNKIQVEFKDINDKYEKEGYYTIKSNGASIVKTLVDHEKVNSPEKGILLTWEIQVSDIPEGVTDFIITDDARHYNNNPGNQTLLTKIYLTDSLGHNKVLVVDGAADDGTGIITPDGKDIIESVRFGADGGRYCYINSIVFKSGDEGEYDYIREIAEAKGTITIQVQTLITEDTVNKDGIKEYGNGAKVSYKDPNTGSEWSDDSRATFHDKENLLSKEGTELEDKNAIEYTIKVLLPVLEITEPGKKFIITDKIPTGLSVDEKSITVQLTDQWNNVRVSNSDMKYKPALNEEEQELTVEITATENLIKQIKGYPEGGPDGYYLVVKFTAAVEDQEAFLAEGKSVKFENNASGTYDGDPIGGDTVENELTPAQMVDKTGEYTQALAPYAKYTVHVNRGGITLGVDPLTAVDKLGSALTFVDDDKHTVEVYEVYGPNNWDGEEKLDAGEYSYEISEDKHTLTFTKLPDGKHLRIVYYAYVDFEHVETLDETNAGNEFVLLGNTSEQSKGGYQFTGDTFKPNGWVDSKVGSITLYKFWTNGDDKIALNGSVFEVWKMRIDNGKLVKDDTDGSAVIRENIRITEGNSKGEGMIEIDDLPVNQILALVETKADEGFSLGSPYYFVVDGTASIDPAIIQEYNIQDFKSGDTLEYENTKIKSAQIKIAKIWEESDTNKLTWDEIKDSLSFVIKKKQGEIFQTVQTLTGADLHIDESDGTIRYVSDIISVEPGTYRVVETKSTIPDFEVVTTYVIETENGTTQGSTGTIEEINIQTADEVVTVVYTNTYNYTGTFPVKVSKRSLTGTDEIEGAEFSLSGDTLGTNAKSWTSGNEPEEIELKPGNYTLTETKAPRGYKKATDPIEFTVGNNGEITITQGGSDIENKYGANTVVMKDEPLDVEVRKTADAEGGTIDVAEAELTLYDKKDLDDDYNPHQDTEPLHQWTSEAGKYEQIGRYLYVGDGSTYVLVETKVPENGGYGYSKKIEFKVRDSGEIYDVKYVGGSTAGTEGTTNDTEVGTENTTNNTADNRILMEDKVISIKLSKVDLQKNAINGQAVISVYKKTDIDQDGKPLPNAKAVDTFTFDNSSEPHEFGNKLQPGTEYVFVETGVPTGYKQAKNISFTVEEDGSVTVSGNPEQKDGAYLMYDEKEDEVTASLVIYKTVSGELTLEQINGALKFRVQKISGEGDPYDETFTIAENFKKENGRYVLELNNLPLGTYKVTEIYGGNTPDEITTPDDMKLEVSYTIDSGSEQKDSTPNNRYFETGNIDFTKSEANHTVIFNNDYQYKMGTIKLTKSLTFVGSALNWNDNVAGKLKFHIYKVINPGGGSDERKEEIEGSPVSGSSLTWNEEKKVYEFEMQVPVGTYIVAEKYESVDGYVMTTTHKVNGEEDTASESVYITSKQAIEEGDTLIVGYNNRYVQTHSVAISKRAITGEEELADVTWEITGKNLDGASITPISWTTKKDTATGKVKPHEVTLEPGEYTLTEIVVPIGYKRANPITFKLEGNGNITIISDQTNALDGSMVIMWDDPLDVEVDKVTLGGAAEVKGAKLSLYDDNNGNKLAEHVSGENEVWQIGEYLQLGGTYRLSEELAPDGYGYSADIKFTVDDNGNITNVTAGSAQGNKILMEDSPISIKLNKVELSNTTKELEGAVIGIYYAEDVDANGRLKDPDTKPLETWKSVKGGCHEFGTKLKAGRDYVFVETAAPNGYQVAASIRFTIKKDGSVENVEKVSTVTGGTVMTTKDGGDTVYLMEDEVYTDPNAMLVLTKSIEGAGISLADIMKTNLRFHVESIDVSPAYNQVFRVGDVGFEWDGDSSKYVQYIYNLKPGKYKVTELWDDSAFSGIACTGQTWEMVLDGVSGTGSSGTGVTTGEFNLENGDEMEVNYTNTYESGGTLIITKTIAGDITKEAVDGTLTFTVTENSTNKKENYTLQDDFEYNSQTKQWTKELALTSGGYTVEESVKTPDGTTYTTAYTVNGGTSRNGTGTQVANVIVEKGGTTTVAYTNTYTANDISQDNSNQEDEKEDEKEDDKKDEKEDDQEDDKEDDQEDEKEDDKKDDKKDDKESNKETGKSNSVDNTDVYDNDSPSVVGKMVKTVEAGLIKTGDIVPVGAWLLMMMLGIAGLGVGGYALMRRKEKELLEDSADELKGIKIK
ncbi:MAG: hypothetical protein J1F18_03715 [Lachnospiraceae bacterium]|nr:hypothetical protein [Lachnospiraceae bacterium]